MPAAAGAAPKGFKDLKDDYWAKKEIEFLVNKKIINGYDDITFKPNKGITNAQGAVILVRALNLKTEKDTVQIYKDVKKKHFAYKEISAAVKAGIFEKGDKFYPNKPMTRADVAMAISKAFNIKGTGNVTFKDVAKTSPAYEAISALAEYKIITGYPDGTFKPDGKVTRAQFAVMVARVMNKEFIPDFYEIPVNVNPITIMFKYVLVNPDAAQYIFLPESKFNLKEFGKNVITFENVNFKEIARVNGLTEFVVTFDTKLDKNYKGSLVEKGNRLYVVVKKTGNMEFKISAIGTTPHLTADGTINLTDQQALKLIDQSHIAYMTVVRGGDGKRDDSIVRINGTDYRYLAESLNTMEKLQKYLQLFYTSAKADALIKELKITTYNGKTILPIADGGSIADYSRASIKLINSTSTVRNYEVVVPLGNLKDTETKHFELHFVPNVGWRVAGSFSDFQSLTLIADAKNAYWTVVRGGDGNRPFITFMHNGTEYRYMAESLSTMEKLKSYLGAYYTPTKVEDIIKKLRIITYNGKLAQPNADGGSLLDYRKASIKPISSVSSTVRIFELIVPLSDTGKSEKVTEEIHLIAGQGWRVAEAISSQQAIDLFAESNKTYWTVVSGGEGKRVSGSFDYKGINYRWMAESLDTMQELKDYLNIVYTPAKSDELIKQLGIVEVKGKLAQPVADGGSLLNYSKASINSIKGSELKREFELIVPLGDTGLKEKTHGELQFVVGSGWRVSNLK